MQRYFLGSLVLSAAAFLAGCTPAEVKPPPESIPNIPAGRATPASDGGGGAAVPGGRTPAAPK